MQNLTGRTIRSVRASRALGWLVAGSVLAGAAVPAGAQCQSGWLDGPDIPASGFGTNGIVRAVISWDPDGAGPALPVLVIGGQFTVVGGTTAASNIAMWNGASWQPLSSGCTGTSAIVTCLAVFNDQLIAAGTFTSAGGVGVNNIARWTGSWATLGAGLTGGSPAQARAMAVYNGQLYVTGSFGTAGGVALSGMARWNGASWSSAPAGGGTDGWAAAAYNGDLYVGGNGDFSGNVTLERFNGASWSSPGPINGKLHPADSFPFIRALSVLNGKLYIGGNFKNAGSFINVNGLIAWDSAALNWTQLSTGLDEPCFAMATVGSSLYVGGAFNTAGNISAVRVARWDGTSWGSSPSQSMSGGGPSVLALAGHNGEAYAGGSFTTVNSISMNNLVRFAGGVASPVANATPVRCMSGAVTAGGDFVVNTGGGVFAQHIAGWGGSTPTVGAYSDLGGFTGTNGPVYALGTLSVNPFTPPYTVFGGSFNVCAGFTANNIATYRFGSWGTLSTGFNGTVRALATYKNSLYAGGDFTTGSGNACSFVAKYVSGVWQPVAGGMNGPVHALYVHNGWLYAGGTFTAASGIAMNYIAAYNGTGNWGGVADGLSGNGTGSGVYCFTSYAGDAGGPYLVLGGKFRTNFSNTPNLANQGSVVALFGSYGTGFNDTVRAATLYENDLVVGGDFTATPGGAMSRIARFKIGAGGGWFAMGSGVDSTVYCLLPTWGSELQVGGAFATAGGLPNAHWARWNTSGRPAISQQPSGQTALGCDATFTVGTPSSYTGLTYQWQRDGVNLVNGPNANGAMIAGANSATLSMTNLSVADEGAYSCVVSNGCGSTTSSSATLDVCGGDYNCDGFIDPLDYNAFINDFESGSLNADYNRDGFLDPLDYNAFINDFEAGC